MTGNEARGVSVALQANGGVGRELVEANGHGRLSKEAVEQTARELGRLLVAVERYGVTWSSVENFYGKKLRLAGGDVSN